MSEQAAPGLPNSFDKMIENLPPLGELQDKYGNKFFFGNTGDYWHPPMPVGVDFRLHVQRVKDLEIRKDDILVCSFPKTGLHWHVAMINMLLKGKAEHDAGGYEMQGFLDMMPTTVIDSLPSPRLLVTHMPFRYLPRQVFEKKIKVIYLDRNPKDVMVSFYHHLHNHKYPLNYPGTFQQMFELQMEVGMYYGDIFDYLMEWQRGREANPDLAVLTSVFEEVKLNPVKAVERLNDFLGTGCSPEVCKDIAIACGFKNLKSFKDANDPQIIKDMFQENAPGFYRKGEIGDWKNYFTVAMNERFNKVFQERMKDYKTKYIFSK